MSRRHRLRIAMISLLSGGVLLASESCDVTNEVLNTIALAFDVVSVWT